MNNDKSVEARNPDRYLSPTFARGTEMSQNYSEAANDPQNSRPLDIVLWGGQQVGKSTLLAAYLCHAPPSWVDFTDPETHTAIDGLSEIWNFLRTNRIPPATLDKQIYPVRHKQGPLIRFRDMKGGNASDLARNRGDAEALRRADALMILMEWPGSHRTVLDLVAAETALRSAVSCPMVVVITKAECYLTREKMALFSITPLEVAEEMKLPPDFIDFLRRVQAADIIPVSVYGYAGEYPAHYRDEFGRLVPRYIKPLNITLPFERALGAIV